MTSPPVLRWGIMGTANIARAAFLPALRSAGGVAEAVASRDRAKADSYAAEHGIERGVGGYQALIEDARLDALYIALPNSLHAQWTTRALEAGKPVLCEKPLCGTLADTERVLSAARQTGTLLWEAFVFPFHEQMDRIRSLMADGAIGDLREIQSDFHFKVSRPENIRLSTDLQGGALLDVGCYPIRLAQEFFADHVSAAAARELGGHGVDVETWGTLGYSDGRRLLLSCGMRREYDTFTRLLGTEGQIHVSNPFHPGPDDEVTLYPAWQPPTVFPATDGEPSFTAALRHISAAIARREEPRLLATQTSLATARALHDLATG